MKQEEKKNKNHCAWPALPPQSDACCLQAAWWSHLVASAAPGASACCLLTSLLGHRCGDEIWGCALPAPGCTVFLLIISKSWCDLCVGSDSEQPAGQHTMWEAAWADNTISLNLDEGSKQYVLLFFRTGPSPKLFPLHSYIACDRSLKCKYL